MNNHGTKCRYRSLFAALLLGLLGVLAATTTAQAAVGVDQIPLTVQKPLAPNLVLMLDDSGSMQWDYMPDWGYLSDTSDDGVRDSDVNGTYYDPTVLYTPPPTANGGTYPNSGTDSNDLMGTAYADGFHPWYGTADVTTYSSPFENFPYYEKYTTQVTTTYPPVPGCNNGDNLVQSGTHQGECVHTETTYTYYKSLKKKHGHRNRHYCNPGDQLVSNGRECRHAETTYTYYAPDPSHPSCPSGGSYDSSQGACVRPQDITAYLFTYTELNPNGTNPRYIRHYVGKSQDDCSVALSADTTSGVTCDYSIAAQQNVANWFSYYRTRILMTKSGIMNAFSGIDPSFRVGFGSINGRNNGALPSPTAEYNYKKIAEVEPFGDGSASTQKSSLWNWLVGIDPLNGTPLRLSLDAVGQYYGSSQPWQTSASDHTELACRQSYTILTTDGFWNGSTPSNIGNTDNTKGSLIKGANSQKYQYKPVEPYADDNSNTLADVAMKYWDTDLRPTISNEVLPSTEDPAFWQHMTTFTLGLGLTPTGITPAGTTVDQIFTWANGGSAIPGFSWPKPSSSNGGSIYNIADLAHAAVDGHGQFESATSPQALASGLEDALKRVASRVGTGASLAANSTKLQTGTTTYQALYYTGTWKGDLKAFAVNPDTGAIATTPNWTASGALPAWNQRKVYFNTAGNSTLIAFDAAHVSSLSTDEQIALGNDSTAQTAVVNYLLGDDSNEQKNNGAFRNRDTALGDIVNSQPVYVGTPNTNAFYGKTFPGSDTYAAFASTNVNRTPEIWVAANDGMLHAFDAGTGAETFAYLPSAVITHGIKNLTDPDYGSSVSHEYYNDGELTVADVYMNSAWHTVLVGTTGRGPAEAVYALDVTNPASPSLLWERSAADGGTDSSYIGQITSKPVIAQTANGTWSVLIGNGYNSASGTAALLQFDLATGNLTAYLTNTATNNGLAAPAAWIGTITNNVSTIAYAGDLKGNVWSFDLTDPGSKGKLLFTAEDSNGNAQPITAGMLAGKDPTNGNVWLFFGTGQYLSQADLSDTNTQTWYGIIVQATNAGSTLVSNLANGRAALIQRKILAETAPDPTADPPTLGSRVVTPGTSGDTSGKSGWYIDLTSPNAGVQGERMVLPNEFQGSLLIGTTRIPTTTDECNPSGSGWIMTINPFTGTNPTTAFFDLNNDGQFTSADLIIVGGKQYASAGVGFNSVPNNPIFVGNTMLTSFDNATTSSIDTAGSAGAVGRVSWRELVTQ